MSLTWVSQSLVPENGFLWRVVLDAGSRDCLEACYLTLDRALVVDIQALGIGLSVSKSAQPDGNVFRFALSLNTAAARS